MKERKGNPTYKMTFNEVILLLLLLCSCVASQTPSKKPNIVFIVADDLGWDDVSFHGSPQIPTPNIDSLAKSGVILNNYYVSPSSFSTKTEFMTGKYATHLGTQHGVLHNKQPFGLPYKEKILPQYLKEAGYNNYAIGKWALGYYKKEMLPWKRGFDYFYGGLTSSGKDYYTHSAFDDNYGLDLRRNEEVVHNETGNYITEVYTTEAVNIIKNYNDNKPLFLYVAHQAVHTGNADDPLQAPEAYQRKVKHIKNSKRKLFAGMVLALDESVLNITIALSEKGLLDNTVIIFTTDAGGAVGGQELSSASNFPLRGSKLTVWEGGVRAVAFVYSDLIRNKGRVSLEMYHSTDWLPTILGLAGIDTKELKIDGFDVWKSINEGEMSPRFEILHQFDPLAKNLCSLRVGDYKLIINQDIGFYGDWYPRPAEVGELRFLKKIETLPNAKVTCDKNYPHPFLEMHAPPCDPMKKPCMFNILWDPCEFHNLAEFMPNTLKVLLDRLQFYRITLVKPIYPGVDSQADPENSDGVWSPWVNTSILSVNPHAELQPQWQQSLKYDTSNKIENPSIGNQLSELSVNNKGYSEVNSVLAPQTNKDLGSASEDTTAQIIVTTSPPLYSIMDQVVTPLLLGPGLISVSSANETKNMKGEPTMVIMNNQFETSPQDISISNVLTTQPPPKLITSYLVKNISEYEATESPYVNYAINSTTTPFIEHEDHFYTHSPLKGAEYNSNLGYESPNQATDSSIQSSKLPTQTIIPFANNTTLVPAIFDDKIKPSITSADDNRLGIQIVNRNASRQHENAYMDLTENELRAGNNTRTLDMTGKTTNVYIVQNENGGNPLQTNLVNDDFSLHKNISETSTSINSNGLSFVMTNDATSQYQNKLVLESGKQTEKLPIIKVEELFKTTISPSIDSNDSTGQGKHAMPFPDPSEKASAFGSIKISGATGGTGFVLSKAIAGENSLTHYNILNKDGSQTSMVSTNKEFNPLGPGVSGSSASTLLGSPSKFHLTENIGAKPLIPINATQSQPDFSLPSTPPPPPPPPPSPFQTSTTTFAPPSQSLVTSSPYSYKVDLLPMHSTTSPLLLTSSPETLKILQDFSHGQLSPQKFSPAFPPGYTKKLDFLAPYILDSEVEEIVPNKNKLNNVVPIFAGKTGKKNPPSGIPLAAVLPSQTVPVVSTTTNKAVEHAAVSITPEMIQSPLEPSNPGKDSVSNFSHSLLPPAEHYPPLSASLRPDSKKVSQTGNASKGSLSLGSGSESSTSTETEVSANSLTEAKTDSKLPALQNPYILASLKNIADAGSQGKSGLSSEVALVTGSDLGPGKVSLPSAQNFVKEPEYQSITKPDFEKPQNPFKQGGSSSRMSAGSSAGGGSETETETVVGAGASTGSGTKIGTNLGSKGPRVKSKKLSTKGAAKVVDEKNSDTNNSKNKFSSLKNSKGLKASLNALAGQALGGADFSLLNGQHSGFPNAVVAGYRPFQSVDDVVSDSSNQMCGESRNCISQMPIVDYQEAEPEEKFKLFGNKSSGMEIQGTENIFRAFKAGIQVTESGERTQATSNQSPVTVNNDQNKTSQLRPFKSDESTLNRLPAQEKLHKFFGEIKVDNKKMFFISGTASEDKDLVYTQSDSSGLVTQNDVRKHNIGFNVVLPSNIVKQLTAPESNYVVKSKVENSTKPQAKLHSLGEKPVIHQKNKSITKLFDTVADTARSRKMKVESPPVEENPPGIRGNIETINVEVMGGMNGDIGATKPLKGSLSESRKLSDDFVKSEIINVTDNVIEAKIQPNSNIDAGDLGSIVTLVGKVKVDRLSSKRMKGIHNSTKENNAHKKTVKDHMSVKQPKINISTETNAANINSLKGPTNSFIVSSVIVVLLASFVVVGMAVVAVVAVVARHCRVAKHFDAS